MVSISIPAFSALQSVSLPRDYHFLSTIVSSSKPFKAKWNGYQLDSLSKTNVVVRAYSTRRRGSDNFRNQQSTTSSRSRSRVATLEDSEDGSGSDFEEEDEDNHNLGSESEWEEDEEKGAPAADKSLTDDYEEQLVNEVDQLLNAEERAILQQNAAPNIEKLTTAKWSPLHTVSLSGFVTFMDKLLEDGVDINLLDKDGLTPLHTAIIGKKEAVISHLLRKGASPHVRDRDGATPLHYAVQVGTKRIVKLLIKYKVDVNIADKDGWTPLHIAVQSRNRDIVKILLVNGADKSRRNKDGRLPLDLGFCYGKDFKSYDLTKLLKTVPMDRDF